MLKTKGIPAHSAVTDDFPDSFEVPQHLRGNRTAIIAYARQTLPAATCRVLESAMARVEQEVQVARDRLPFIAATTLLGCEASSVRLDELDGRITVQSPSRRVVR